MRAWLYLTLLLPVFLIAFSVACIARPAWVFKTTKRCAEFLGHNVDSQVRSEARVVQVIRVAGVLTLPASIAALVFYFRVVKGLAGL